MTPFFFGTTFANTLNVRVNINRGVKMYLQKLFRHFTIITVSLFSIHMQAQLAPPEVSAVQIKHTAQSASPFVATLSKNIFKTESYQAEYTIQVPYEVTEQYTVEIPYQTTETYEEQVPYTVDVPYTDYETAYRNEYVCHDRTNYRNECHNEQRCYIVPGTGGGQQCRNVEECGVNSQGQRICKMRQVCDGGGNSGPQQQCDTQQVCSQVPFTDQQCADEQVPYQREVIKHRTETRYRTETRTRTVTKSRTETKCCVTKTREVFDHQLSFQISVMFPQAAILSPTEIETLKLTLSSADLAHIDLTIVDSIYGYKIATQSVSGATIQVELALVPKYDLSNAGPETIVNYVVDHSPKYDKFRITFNDKFKANKVTTKYMITVTDLAGNLIEELPASSLDANGKSLTRIKTQLDIKTKIIATLKVRRESPLMLDGALEFQVTGKN